MRPEPPDARSLVWLALLALASGIPLAIWFREDPVAHAAMLPPVGEALRALHAAASFVLVAAVLAHVGLRLTRGPRTARGMRTGALALLAVSVAVVTGAAAAQTDDAAALLAVVGLERDGVVLWAALGHMAYAALVVVVAVLVHVKGPWARLLGRRVDAVAAVVAVALVAASLNGVAPGRGAWTTWLLAPPWPVLWAWTALVAVTLYGFAPWAGSRKA